jgi:hypothetical protein
MTTRRFSATALARILTGATLLAFTALFAQTAPHLITLDHGGAPQSPNYARARGEYSFANGPANFYAFSPAHVGEPALLEAVTLRFSTSTTITKIESASADFVVEDGGSCMAGNSYGKGDTCIVLMRFTPRGPGRRLGRLKVSHTGSAEPEAFGLGGSGYASAISFVPALTAPIAATYSSSESKGVLDDAPGLTVDGGDILYIADGGNAMLREIDSSGTLSSVGVSPAAPASLAVDDFGFVYFLSSPGNAYYFNWYAPWGGYDLYNTAYAPGTCTDSSPCGFSTVGMDGPGFVSIDSGNNLFMAERTKGALEMPVAGWAGGSATTLDLWYLRDDFEYTDGSAAALAVNAGDEIFSNYYFPGAVCFIVEEPLYGAETSSPNYTRVAGGEKCGYSGDGGQAAGAEIGTSIGQIAFDIAGDLYFTDSANERVRMISAQTGIITTVAGSGTNGFTDFSARSTAIGLSNPTGLAVDSQGQIYIITSAPSGDSTQAIEKVSATGYLVFGNTTEGATSAAQIVTVSNVGNDQMVLNNYAFTGTDPSDYSIDPTTTTCPLTAGSYLDAGSTCYIGVKFKPATTGTLTANLVLLDNTVTGSNTIELVGDGEASDPDPAFAPGSVSFPATATTHSITVPVTVTNKGNVDLKIDSITLGGANADAFTLTGDCADGSIAPGTACKLNVTFKPLSVGSYSAALKFKDNAHDSPQSVTVSGSGVKPATSATKLTSAANPAPACSSVQFHVSVSTSDGGAATGPVSLHLGALTLASGTLRDGAATLTVRGLTPGLNILTASYGGDTEHDGSTSAALSQMVDRGSCDVFKPLNSARDVPVADRP